jgi:hypothetical protein
LVILKIYSVIYSERAMDKARLKKLFDDYNAINAVIRANRVSRSPGIWLIKYLLAAIIVLIPCNYALIFSYAVPRGIKTSQ